MCSEQFAFVVNLYFMLLLFLSFVLFSILFIIHLKICKVFHPFFRILFAEIIISYLICAVCVIIRRSIALGFIPDIPYIEDIVDVSYTVITPLFLACVIDRLLATVFYKRYETQHTEFWIVFAVLQVLVAVVTYLQCFASGKEMLTDSVLIFISLVTIAFLIILVYINSYLTKSDCKRRSSIGLSQRFQLTENLRIVRNALIPIIAFDCLITSLDVFMYNVFHIEFIFEIEECKKNVFYGTGFIILNTISICLEFAIPLTVLLRWRSFRTVFLSWFRSCCGRNNVYPSTPINKIKNVFGEVLRTEATQQDYFKQLQDQWSK